MGHIRAFKPKLCCIINPEVICHCEYSLCSKHIDRLQEHIFPRPATNYYYHCKGDPLAVVWQDIDSTPTRYRLAFYENQEAQEDQGPYKEVVGSFKSGDQGRRRQKEVPKSKRKRRVA